MDSWDQGEVLELENTNISSRANMERLDLFGGFVRAIPASTCHKVRTQLLWIILVIC